MNLKEKNILITGGSMGIGLATARACLQQGGNVLICARNLSGVEEAVAQLKEEGHSQVFGLAADVSNEKDVEMLFDELEKKFGPVTSVIHAAGVYGPIGPISSVNPEDWFDGIRINLFGSFLIARHSCLRFKKNGGGRLVLFSGGGAASPFPNYTSYACSKAAIVRLCETAAQEMAPYNIEINCVGPGFVITRLHQKTLEAAAVAGAEFVEKTKTEISRGGVPAEIGANAAAFLISDDAAGINGKFIAAPYDSWKDFPKRLKELKGSDLFTLRRIVPKDRGMSWQ
ncbi:MAG: SDR family oxidoreductase [Verrucomicrobia bacterium]|nr:SDR family oxidoreductase [Verrucomicrobiota bacterium]